MTSFHSADQDPFVSFGDETGAAPRGISASPHRFDARSAWLDDDLVIDAKPQLSAPQKGGLRFIHFVFGAALLGAGGLFGAMAYERNAEVARLQTQLHELSARVATAQIRADQSPPASSVRTLRANDAYLRTEINRMRASLEAVDRAQRTADVKMTTSIAQLQKDPRIEQLAGQLAKLEQQVSSSLATGSIPRDRDAAAGKAKKAAPPEALKAKSIKAESKGPQAELQGYVLRSVKNGVALVEDGIGVRQVAPGDYLPGAGRVQRIERRDGDWVVVTSQGVIDGLD